MCTITTCAGIVSCSIYSSSCAASDVVCSWANPYSVWIAASCRSEVVLWMVENFSDKLVYLLFEHQVVLPRVSGLLYSGRLF